MIKTLRITVDGKPYDVTVEMEDEPSVAAPVLASAPSPSVVAPSPAPLAAVSPGSVEEGSPLGAIVSPLAGRVTALNVALGQSVKEGEHVLTLEAMKMNTFIFAQKGGRVKEIRVAVGDAVQENQPMILLE